MQLLKNLWRDTSGAVVSAEAVLVGSLGVLAAGTGLNAVRDDLNAELRELSCAFRGLDQSYHVDGQEHLAARTAGSCYRQPIAAAATSENDSDLDAPRDAE